ncbi:Ceramide phosphoethanolamine synthase [Dirofilaria immitis]
MEADVNAELLKTCWDPLGFKLANRHCAAKFHIMAGQLHTMVTDYECIYYEVAGFIKKFSSLNARLGGPDKVLLEKVRNMFISSTTKVLNENKDHDVLKFDLELVVGKRTLKWHFFGQHLDSTNYIFSHITRPLLNILSLMVDEYDLSLVQVSGSGSSFSNLFGKPTVQKLYKVVVAEFAAAENDSVCSGSIKICTGGSKQTDKNSANSLSGTPAPTSPYEVMSDTVQKEKFREIQALRESPLKKPTLRF